MKYLQNPVTGDMKEVHVLAIANKLASYGWRYVSKADYKAWQVAKVLRRAS